MYAIIELKGKQFTVSENDIIFSDLIEGESVVGNSINVDKVLLLSKDGSTQIGQPYVEGASVTLAVEKEVKGEKLIAFKYRHNKNSKSKKGHRQRYHKLNVVSISAS